jgi:prepilin-type N-terminal cleavage/methylation domain-containing protein
VNRPAKVSTDHESGFSLIEIIVTIVVAGILSTAIVMIFVNSWRTQERVTSVTEATTRGQLVSSALERAMRNARAFVLSPEGDSLMVYTTLEGKDCQGFSFEGGDLRFAQRETDLETVEWPLWQDRIEAVDGGDFLTPTATGVAYSFSISADGAPVRFSGEASFRTPQSGEVDVSTCWSN